ncbi:MAG: aspartate kinase, partial [Flavobacteriales bacterium]
MKVLKFGGTSLAGADRIRRMGSILEQETGPCIVVLSAIGDTTDELTAFIEELRQGERGKARERIGSLEAWYRHLIASLFGQEGEDGEARNLLEGYMEQLRGYARRMLTIHEEREILAQGELLSSGVIALYLKQCGKELGLLSALDIVRVDEDREPDRGYLDQHLQEALEREKGVELFLIQGFICRDPFGKVDHLKRGGSDLTASLLAASLGADQLCIWTDVDGVQNNDPRVVAHAEPVRRMSYDEAAELSYFGAKVLHPSSIRPAKEAGVPVKLKNSFAPDAEGTLVQDGETERVAIRAIAAKDGITAVRVRSGRMLMAYGFLKRVFEIFELYRTPIDMITTSEVAVSLTIDDDSCLESILPALREFGTV